MMIIVTEPTIRERILKGEMALKMIGMYQVTEPTIRERILKVGIYRTADSPKGVTEPTIRERILKEYRISGQAADELSYRAHDPREDTERRAGRGCVYPAQWLQSPRSERGGSDIT